MRRQTRSAFTLLEILVVLSIAAVVSGMTVAGFSSVRNSNRKTTCQTNLTLIYQACRLYKQDFETFPYYNPGSINAAAPSGGIGLWGLYTYSGAPDTLGAVSKATPANNAPIGSYLRNISTFHCPDDNYIRNTVRSNQLYLTNDADTQVFNPDYNSYQVLDGPTPTYSLFRADSQKRQLVYFDTVAANLGERPTADTTVVTWCKFHRKLDGSGNTVAGGGNFDNVLFYDGSIQWLPATQQVSNSATGGSATGTCVEWNRVPREMVDNLTTPTTCEP